jgi:hypothetical protein
VWNLNYLALADGAARKKMIFCVVHAARRITSVVQLVGIGTTTIAGWLVDCCGLIRVNIVGTLKMVATGLPAIAIGLNGIP